MTANVVILGGGTGGTLTANRLRKQFSKDELAITWSTRTGSTCTSPACCSCRSGSPTART